jgi:hypothetical protein
MAVSDILAIWQKALANVGAKSNIASITEQSAEAAACALNYEDTVKELIRSADWNFCRRRVALEEAPSGAVWPPSWEYMYLYPADCIAIRGFDYGAPLRYYPYNEVPYEEANDATAGRVIYMNEEPSPVLVYSAYNFDSGNGFWEARFDPGFQNAVEWGLASAIGPSIGASARNIQRADQGAEIARQRAMAANGNQRSPLSMDQAQAESLLTRGAIDPYQFPYPSTR